MNHFVYYNKQKYNKQLEYKKMICAVNALNIYCINYVKLPACSVQVVFPLWNFVLLTIPNFFGYAAGIGGIGGSVEEKEFHIIFTTCNFT